ncbi:glycosyltransferase family 8 protein [Rhizobium deserti]|nr:glycosyltransferase [Rhizobium deserti]
MNRRNAVVLVTDDNLLPPALHLWSRLRSLNNRNDTDVLLFMPDKAISEMQLLDLTGVIPISSLFMPTIKYSGPSHVTEAACLRIVVPRYLQQNYSKLLYLDIDVVVSDASIFRVFDIELNAPLAATRWHKKSFDPSMVVNGKLQEGAFAFTRYFNSGVLLINADRYVEAEIDVKAFKFLAEEEGKSEVPDQTALNVAVGDGWEELSPAMNFRAELLQTFLSKMFPPVVIHYVGEKKSWHTPSISHPLRSEQIKWLALNGHWHFLVNNIRVKHLLRAIRRRINGKGHSTPTYIQPQNRLIKDYLAVAFVDHWNVQPARL